MVAAMQFRALLANLNEYMVFTAYLINEGFDQPVHTRRLGGAFAHRAPVCI